ncbi:MAG: carbohydrate-binding protein [Prevotella sp.]|nr:carbohydrate-binding protein [Prevotella sp.]
MKKLFTSTLKAAALTVALLSGGSAAVQAQTFQVGDPVTSFVANEEFGIIEAPLLSTDTELNNWAAPSTGEQNRLGDKWDPRAWYAVFEIEAPAAGKYGVELQVRSTTNNWQVAFSTSTSLEVSERANVETAPTWEQYARAIKLSKVVETITEIQPAQGDPVEDPDNYVPAITETTYAFGEGEWETIYTTVDLVAGHNYVTFWLSRHFLDDDSNMKAADGGVLGFYVKSLKVLPTEAAAPAEVLQQATRRIWMKDNYGQMSTAANASLNSNYNTLLAAVAAANYTASTAALQADIEATDQIEYNLRHVTGQVIGGNNANFDLPFYHFATDGICENERGYYADAPVIFEYTNNKDLVYKFTTTEAGVYYPRFYVAAAANNQFHVNILAADSVTKVMNQWDIDGGTGAWQTYEDRVNSTIYKFEAEAGATYFMTMHIDNYVNFRGITIKQVTREQHTYAETEELSNKANDLYAEYGSGMKNYMIGGNQELLNALAEAIDAFTELAEDDDPELITDVYYQLQEAIAQLEVAPKYNVLPSTEETPFNLNWYSNISNAGTKQDGGITQIDNLRSNGWVEYTIYNTKDQAYKMDFEFGSANSAELTFVCTAKVEYEGETLEIGVTESNPLPGTGGWQNFEPQTMNIPALPEGIVTLRFSCKIDASYAGNPRQFVLTPLEGTEGQGAQAVAKAYEDLKTLYSDDKFAELYSQAEALIAQYSDADTYEQNLVVALQKAVDNARDAQANAQTLTEKANAYKALEAAIANMANIKTIEWQTIPATEENPFDLKKGAFTRWQVEGAGNIGYGYQGGSVEYCIDVTEASGYNMILEMANPAEGASIRTTVTQAGTEIYNEVKDVPNTGSWNDHQDVIFPMALPQAKVRILIYGETAAGNWVGNIYSIKFEKADLSGISAIAADQAQQGIYTLQGVRVSAATKGLYIINGKKMVVK